jgi:hypothetical protein
MTNTTGGGGCVFDVDKIARSANPAELPVEQPTRHCVHGERSFAEGERFRWLTEFDGSWAPNYEPN